MCTLKRIKLILNDHNFSNSSSTNNNNNNTNNVNNCNSDSSNSSNIRNFRKFFDIFMCTTEKSPSKMANAISSVKNYIRNTVSKQRRRYTENGYNLDLAYICDNIIAMGYPADNLEGIYRNRIDDVYQFLEETHQNHYKIYNLCSERSYDKNKFHGRVAIYPFADHNPPTIELIQQFCDDIDRWLTTDESNVAAVHCKAGKGRTGTMICCYLLHCNFVETADDALCYYDEKRTKDKKGVTIPSQRRYVDYYSKLIRSRLPYIPLTLQLCKIHFSSALVQNTVLCSVSTLKDPSCPETVTTLQTFSIDFKKTQSIDIKDRIELTGDVRIELYQKITNRKKFHFWFNTFFIYREATREGEGDDVKLICEFKKSELDALKDKEHKIFAEDFTVQLILHPNSTRTTCACNGVVDLITSTQNHHDQHKQNNSVIFQQKPQQYTTNSTDQQNMPQNHKTNNRNNHNNGSCSSFEFETEQHQSHVQNFTQLISSNNIGSNCYHEQQQNQHQQQQQNQNQKFNKIDTSTKLYDPSTVPTLASTKKTTKVIAAEKKQHRQSTTPSSLIPDTTRTSSSSSSSISSAASSSAVGEDWESGEFACSNIKNIKDFVVDKNDDENAKNNFNNNSKNQNNNRSYKHNNNKNGNNNTILNLNTIRNNNNNNSDQNNIIKNTYPNESIQTVLKMMQDEIGRNLKTIEKNCCIKPEELLECNKYVDDESTNELKIRSNNDNAYSCYNSSSSSSSKDFINNTNKCSNINCNNLRKNDDDDDDDDNDSNDDDDGGNCSCKKLIKNSTSSNSSSSVGDNCSNCSSNSRCNINLINSTNSPNKNQLSKASTINFNEISIINLPKKSNKTGHKKLFSMKSSTTQKLKAKTNTLFKKSSSCIASNNSINTINGTANQSTTATTSGAASIFKKQQQKGGSNKKLNWFQSFHFKRVDPDFYNNLKFVKFGRSSSASSSSSLLKRNSFKNDDDDHHHHRNQEISNKIDNKMKKLEESKQEQQQQQANVKSSDNELLINLNNDQISFDSSDFYSSLCDRQLSFGTSPCKSLSISVSTNNSGKFGSSVGITTNSCDSGKYKCSDTLNLIEETSIPSQSPIIIAKPIEQCSIGFFQNDDVVDDDDNDNNHFTNNSNIVKENVVCVNKSPLSRYSHRNQLQRQQIDTNPLNEYILSSGISSSNEYENNFKYFRNRSKSCNSIISKGNHFKSLSLPCVDDNYYKTINLFSIAKENFPTKSRINVVVVANNANNYNNKNNMKASSYRTSSCSSDNSNSFIVTNSDEVKQQKTEKNATEK